METPQRPSPIERRIREGLSRIATVLRIGEWDGAKGVGINPTQLAILSLLEGRRREGFGVKDIAAHLGVSQPTATDSINALERKAYLAKHPGHDDRRAVRLALTPAGAAALQAARPDGGLAEQAIAALDEGEREDLLLILVKMIRHLQDAGSIPVQRMCVTCRHFAPFAHADAARPHHCRFVDAAFGQGELRIDCHDHEPADPAFRAATREVLQPG